MKVQDLLSGMEVRAMDAQFQKDICAIYNAKDYGNTDPDCKLVTIICCRCSRKIRGTV